MLGKGNVHIGNKCNCILYLIELYFCVRYNNCVINTDPYSFEPNYMLKIKVAFFLLVFAYTSVSAISAFDKASFYNVMATGDMEKVDREIEVVQNTSIREKLGYEAVLLIRKAGLLAKPKDKLKYFKEGRIKFEKAISDDDNSEYHFLRLTIEENAPNVVKYKSDIEKDKQYVITHFKNYPPVVQRAIMEYCKRSKVLHKEDLNFTANG